MRATRRVAMMLLCFALTLAGLPALATSNPAAGEGVRARLAPVSVLRGKFEQVKHVQGFRNPLRSSGEFLLSRERGVVWMTRAPFASTLVLTPDQLSIRQADGRRQPVASGAPKAGPSRAAALANGLMLALVTGDVGALQRQFAMKETLFADGAWTLVLVPHDPSLKKAIARIEMSGARNVTAVRVEEAGGDRTELAFADLRDLPAALTPAEAARFE